MDAVIQMIRYVRISDPERKITLSLEIEKASDNRDPYFLEDLDYFFISKDYARTKGCMNLDHAMDRMPLMIPKDKKTQTTFICGWGDVGAQGCIVNKGAITSHTASPAFPPKNGLVDSTGAGDSFIAANIFAFSVLKYELKDAVEFACQFAGAKCGLLGQKVLDEFDKYI